MNERLHLNEIAENFLREAPKISINFEPLESAPWIEDIEEKMGTRFPPSFRALYTRYLFPSFYVSPIEFFANLNSSNYEDIKERLFRDKIISKVTLENRFIHFARCEDGSYDPICFNRNNSSNKEYQIVRLDHELILQFEKIEIVSVISPSLKDFMLGHIKH